MKIDKRDSSIAIDKELATVIAEHIKDDTDITVRSLVRRMHLVKNASSITRNSDRMEMIEIAKRNQQDTRLIASKIAKNSSSSDKQKIVRLEIELLEALQREKNLKVAFIALMKASAIHGVNWISFFESYQIDINKLPKADNVKSIK